MKGNIPVLWVEGRSIPEVWEISVLKTWGLGAVIATEYDRSGDPPSRDCSMVMVIEEPLAEPRIHRSFPADLETLEVYRQEVIFGVHDSHVGSQGWSYSYHDRLFNYPGSVDQIQRLVEKLAESPHSRRAQAITWIPEVDSLDPEPPCLQRVWCRLLPNEDSVLVLNLNTHWRSRDALKAAFMNMFALTELQRWVAEQIATLRGERVLVGRFMDVSDSYHIYGKDWKEFEKFQTLVQDRSFEERTWTTEYAEPFFEEARRRLGAATSPQRGSLVMRSG